MRDVRVKGAVGVVELDSNPDLQKLRARFVDAGVWIRPFERYVYLMPALTIEPHELSVLTRTIYDVLANESRT